MHTGFQILFNSCKYSLKPDSLVMGIQVQRSYFKSQNLVLRLELQM